MYIPLFHLFGILKAHLREAEGANIHRKVEQRYAIGFNGRKALRGGQALGRNENNVSSR